MSFTPCVHKSLLPLAFLALCTPVLADAPLHGYSRPGPPSTPHARQEQAFGHLPSAPLSAGVPVGSLPPGLKSSATVYGYWPYWGDDLSQVAWEYLTHIAIFGVELASDGSLDYSYRWTSYGAEALDYGRAFGVKVHLCVISFDDDVMWSVLSSASSRSHAIDEIVSLVDQLGGDGVNLDFEGLDYGLKDEFVDFVQELAPQVDELVLAMPAVDWYGSYDYDVLSAASTALFIMGYDYYYSGGNPGPTAPLESGDLWSQWNLTWTVEDYRTYGATDDKLILGLPLFGFEWPTTDNSIPGTSTGDGDALTYSYAIERGASYGRNWEDFSATAYAFPSSRSQLWYDDQEAIETKVDYAMDEGLQGIGFWALTYEDADPDFWNMIREQTASGDDPTGQDTASPVQGDTAGPTPGDTSSPWSQDSDRPATPDTGQGWIAPAPRVYLDETAGGCGCGSVPGPGPAALLAGLALTLVRRRRNTG